MIKFIDQLEKEKLNSKKILLRVDFNIRVEKSKIIDNFRIKSHKETIDYLLNNGARVLLVSHIDKENSFTPIVEELGEMLGQTLTLVPHSELGEVNKLFEVSPLLLLDNIRQDSREMQNNYDFAAELAKGFDYYVNDAFAAMHRNHTSIVAIAKHLPSYAGLLIKKETENLKRALETPAEGKILVFGGAKISTKLPVIKNFLDKSEKILIGGALANNFFKARGINVGASVVDEAVLVDIESEKIILPKDLLISDDKTGKSGTETHPVKDIDLNHMILDIGSETARHYAKIIGDAEMVIWNGPMGLSEVDAFASGTEAVARAIASARHSIIGGGDTIAAVNKLGLLDQYDFVSTGGGAMLEFLAGNKLPGLDVLGYYNPERDS